jgi:hypothetical protein
VHKASFFLAVRTPHLHALTNEGVQGNVREAMRSFVGPILVHRSFTHVLLASGCASALIQGS